LSDIEVPKLSQGLSHLWDLLDDLLYEYDDAPELRPELNVRLAENPESLKTPIVSYKVNSREPDEERTGYKPQWKREQDNPNASGDLVIYGQIFELEILFGIWARSYEEADSCREFFEEFVIYRRPRIRSEGLLELVFQEHEEDLEEIGSHSFVKQELTYKAYQEIKIVDRVENIESIHTRLKRPELREPEDFRAIKDQLHRSGNY